MPDPDTPPQTPSGAQIGWDGQSASRPDGAMIKPQKGAQPRSYGDAEPTPTLPSGRDPRYRGSAAVLTMAAASMALSIISIILVLVFVLSN